MNLALIVVVVHLRLPMQQRVFNRISRLGNEHLSSKSEALPRHGDDQKDWNKAANHRYIMPFGIF